MSNTDLNRLKRDVNHMPDDVRIALEGAGAMRAYLERPPYQQNDYLGWIMRAKLKPTRDRRIRQMLDELQAGRLYMNMQWKRRG